MHPTSWAEWGQMYVNLDLWEPLIEEVLKQESIRYNEISLTKHPGTHAVFQIDDRYILKIYTPLSPDDFRVESSIYKSLDTSEGGGYFPQMVACGEIQTPDRWKYLIVTVIDGSPYRDVEYLMNAKEKEEMASTLAENLKKYHATNWNREEIPEWPIDAYNHLTRLNEKLQRCDIINNAIISEIISFLKGFNPSINLAYTVVHADMTEDHVFLTKKDSLWMLTGMIDVADSKCSSVLLEFPAIWFELFKGDVGLMRVFLKTYDATIPFNEQTRLTLTYYTLIHQFGVDMIEQACERQEIEKVDSFQALVEVMWPKVLITPSP